MSAPHEDDMAPQPSDGEAERSGPFGDGRWDSEASEASDDGFDDGFDGLSSVLRERFQQAVSTLEPGPGTLEYLRRAVPARRRRRHAALAATAVSVFAVSAGAALAARGSFDSGGSSPTGSAIGNLLTTATNDAPGGGSGHGPATPGGRDMNGGGSIGTEQMSPVASVPGTSKPPLSTTAPSATASGSPLAPLCQNSSVTSLTATSNGTTGGVTYETLEGTARATCTLNGTPGLQVTGAGGAPAKIPVYKADQSAAPLLPAVPAVQTLVLQPGERFEFQLAWAPLQCSTPPTTVPPSSGPTTAPTTPTTTAGPTPTGGPTTVSSSQPTPSGTPSSSVPPSSIYSVAYSLSGTQPAQSVSFRADCGATIYVTDYFPAPGQRSMANPTTGAS